MFTASNGVEVREVSTGIGTRLAVKDNDPAQSPGFAKAEYAETWMDPRQASALREFFAARRPILLQAQEDGTDEWFTIRTYPGDPGDRAHADTSAHLLTSQDVPARVIEGEPA